MNAALAGAGGACAALAGVEVLTLLARPSSVAVMSALLGPVSGVARRGRDATREGRTAVTGLAAACGFAALVLAGRPLLGIVAAIAAPVASRVLIRVRLVRWRSAMKRGAASAARAVGDAAAAGLPGVSAIERAATDGSVPSVVANELRDLATRCRLGLSLEEGLAELRRRTGCGAWDAIVSAVLVQRQVGGDLSLILAGLASGLDAADRATAEARSLSAQARLTARIVIAMPLAGLLMSAVASPGTLVRMLESPLPRILVAVALTFQVAAAVTVRRIARLGAAGA